MPHPLILQGFGGVTPKVCFATTYIHSILQQPTFCLCKKHIYEEDCRPDTEDIVPTDENKRLCLAICDSYQISEEHPVFYIGFPEENIYDVVFTLKDAAGKELYRTNYVAPGTNTAIDGTAFLEKGSQQVECLVSVYDHDSGVLISDCTTVVLNINYEG